MQNFYEWLNESLQNIHIDLSHYEDLLQKELISLIGPFKSSEGEYTEEMAQNDLQRLVKETESKMTEVKIKIQEALIKIPSFNTDTIIIEPQVSSHMGRISLEPSSTAYIKLGNEADAPSFMFSIYENQVFIDDVLEGGDTDYFKNQETQNDYFTLIDALRNTGKQIKHKVITLYTARPKKDRQMIQLNQTLPLNVFLTDNEEHAYGLANDLSGGQEIRDVWMVKINSKYLTKTLDGPIKYYQLTVDDAPMDIHLVS
jgi:hypothetical protein